MIEAGVIPLSMAAAVDHRLECRAGIAPGLHGPVELALLEIVASHHGPDRAASRVHGKQGRLGLRFLIKGENRAGLIDVGRQHGNLDNRTKGNRFPLSPLRLAVRLGQGNLPGPGHVFAGQGAGPLADPHRQLARGGINPCHHPLVGAARFQGNSVDPVLHLLAELVDFILGKISQRAAKTLALVKGLETIDDPFIGPHLHLGVHGGVDLQPFLVETVFAVFFLELDAHLLQEIGRLIAVDLLQ